MRIEIEGPLATVTLGRRGPTSPGGVAPLPTQIRVVLVHVNGSSAGKQAQPWPISLSPYDWCSRPGLVSIAAVQGRTCGAGLQLALACDLRVAGDDAEFGWPQVAHGSVPGGTGRLVELLGRSRALEVCTTGRWVSAREAQGWSLVNAVVPGSQLREAARDLAVAVLASPSQAVVEIRALLDGASARTEAQQCKAEQEARVRLLRARTRTEE